MNDDDVGMTKNDPPENDDAMMQRQMMGCVKVHDERLTMMQMGKNEW